MIIEKRSQPEFRVINVPLPSGGVRVQLPDIKAKHGITIKAPSSNGVLGSVYIGNAAVSSVTGLEFPAGRTLFIPIDSPRELWAIGATDDLTLTIMAA